MYINKIRLSRRHSTLCYHRGPSLKWGGSAPFLQSDDIFMKTSQALLLSNLPQPLHLNVMDYLKIFLKVGRKKNARYNY